MSLRSIPALLPLPVFMAMGLVSLGGCSLVFDEVDSSSVDEVELCEGRVRVYPRGSEAGKGRFDHIDYFQGTLGFWVRPLAEGTGAVPLLDAAGLQVAATWPSGLEIQMLGLAPLSVPTEPWTVGEDTFISLRWDSQRPLSGSASLQRHVELRVGQLEYFEIDAPFDPAVPTDAEISMGAEDGSFHVDQLVIYDRPIFVNNDVNVPSELFEMAERKEDAARLVNGGMSVLFASASPGEDGCEAYSADGWTQEPSLLSGDLKVGDTTGWSGESTPSTEPVYSDGGVMLLSPQSLTTTVEVAPGGSYLLDMLTHGVNDGHLLVAITEVDRGELIAGIQGRGVRSREDPERLLLSFDVPSYARSIRIDMASVGEGAHIHDISLRANLLKDTAFEGSELDEVWRRESIDEPEPILLDQAPYASLQSLCIESPSSPEALLQEPTGVVDHEFYLFGAAFFWTGDNAPGVTVANGSFFATGAPYANNNKAGALSNSFEDWAITGTVGRRFRSPDLNSHNDLLRFGSPGYGPNQEALFCIDSAYALPTQRISGNVIELEQQ